MVNRHTAASARERIKLGGHHPLAGEYGKLVAFEYYGPNNMFRGWRVRLDHGGECYANPSELRRDARERG
jgi:hypothetical protein